VQQFRDLLTEITTFVTDVYVDDVTSLGTGPLLGLATSDFGVGHPNYLAYGAFDRDGAGDFLFPGGVIRNLDPGNIAVDALDTSRITESVYRAWYRQTGPLHPSVGETDVDLSVSDAYSFCKAPRYDGHPFEVGPLARMLILKEPRLLALLDQGVTPGTIARHAARAFETTLLCEAMAGWLDELDAALAAPGFRIHDTDHWEPPTSGEGVGLYEAPRGALGHWLTISNGVIERYQAVVPSTWNASPRDEGGVRGPYEESLIGCPVPDEDNPINVVRTIRSFDPCLGCAVHLLSPGADSLREFVMDPITGRCW